MELDDDQLDLEGELNKALDGQEAPQLETPEQAEEKLYVRDGRRYVPKEPKEGKAEEPADPNAAVTAPKQAWKPLWYKDEYGDWNKLGEPLRKALEQRETEAAQAITKHSTAAKSWEPVLKQFEPYTEALQQANLTPQQYVTQLIDADLFLRRDPAAAINWISQQYTGVDIYALADHLYQQQYQPQQVDPRDQQIQTLTQQVQDIRSSTEQARRASVEADLQAWAKDKPHFADVRDEMFRLSQAPRNAQATLDELYEAATYAHPQLRQRILADQRKAEVERARGHATGTRGGSHNGAAVKPHKMSIEDELASLIDGTV